MDAEKARLPLGLTVEQLREVVAASRSWRGVLRAVGSSSAHRGRQLRQACDDLGIDDRHFRHHGFTDAELVEAVRDAETWPDVLACLGYERDSGSARITVRKHCLRLGLPVARLGRRPEPQRDVLQREPDLVHLRTAGAYLVAARLALAGHRISWPLEPAVYDLVVDTGVRLRRVQVKTTTMRKGASWMCSITRSQYAGVAGGKRRIHYSPEEIDDFAVVTGSLDVYLIPAAVVAGVGEVSLQKYEAFRLPRPAEDGCGSAPRGRGGAVLQPPGGG